MIELLKRLKIAYSLYNLFRPDSLSRNATLYKKYGIGKPYYASISSEDFRRFESKEYEPAIPGLLMEDVFKSLPERSKESLNRYEQSGFAILHQFFTDDEVDSINNTIQDFTDSKKVRFRYGERKIMFAIHHSNLISEMGTRPDLKVILNHLIGGEAVLFQSINFVHLGSEQATHSDSIHMTTFPRGGLLGVWVALEDIDEDNGPIHYYPGSHKLPYIMNRDFDNLGNRLLLGNKGYAAYESLVADRLSNTSMRKEIFTAKKGDVLIWHANLLHGGESHKDSTRTRKSMVFHYFEKDAICYHELTQRPALMNST